MKAADVVIAAAVIALLAVLAVGLLVWGYPEDTEQDSQDDGAHGRAPPGGLDGSTGPREPRPA